MKLQTVKCPGTKKSADPYPWEVGRILRELNLHLKSYAAALKSTSPQNTN